MPRIGCLLVAVVVELLAEEVSVLEALESDAFAAAAGDDDDDGVEFVGFAGRIAAGAWLAASDAAGGVARARLLMSNV